MATWCMNGTLFSIINEKVNWQVIFISPAIVLLFNCSGVALLYSISLLNLLTGIVITIVQQKN
jgi:hypothetical protein